DDYVTKPFVPRELLARVRTILRRLTAKPVEDDAQIFRFDGWEMNLAQRRLARADGTEIHLTRAEFDLLAVLASRAGRVQTRDQLLEAVSSRDWAPVDRTVDVLISRLRRKIEADPRAPRLIQTMAGLGYKFAVLVK
ncbi:MAG: response regulator transcription factor, partial [Rhodospirillales bacterium]|nr:response regulator transcription factor [Rhodospirillales bacterium]